MLRRGLHSLTLLGLCLALAGCFEETPERAGPFSAAAPFGAGAGIRPPALAQPTLDFAPPASRCAVQPPGRYRKAVRKASVRRFAWGSVRDGECWATATAQAESGWRPNARSPAGAAGIMQLVPDTARLMGVDDPTDPYQSIRGGVRYLAWCVRQWTHSRNPRPRTFREAARIGSYCYNAGPKRPLDTQRRWGCRHWLGCMELHAPAETVTYVRRVESLADHGIWTP